MGKQPHPMLHLGSERCIATAIGYIFHLALFMFRHSHAFNQALGGEATRPGSNTSSASPRLSAGIRARVDALQTVPHARVICIIRKRHSIVEPFIRYVPFRRRKNPPTPGPPKVKSLGCRNGGPVINPEVCCNNGKNYAIIQMQ